MTAPIQTAPDHNRQAEDILKRLQHDVRGATGSEMLRLRRHSGRPDQDTNDRPSPEWLRTLLPALIAKLGLSGRALDPAGGYGALAAALPLVTTAVEPSEIAADIAANAYTTLKVFQGNFEDYVLERSDARFELIAGEAPVGVIRSDRLDLPDVTDTAEHMLLRGLDLLQSGGILMLLMPRSYASAPTRNALKLNSRASVLGVYQHRCGQDLWVLQARAERERRMLRADGSIAPTLLGTADMAELLQNRLHDLCWLGENEFNHKALELLPLPAAITDRTDEYLRRLPPRTRRAVRTALNLPEWGQLTRVDGQLQFYARGWQPVAPAEVEAVNAGELLASALRHAATLHGLDSVSFRGHWDALSASYEAYVSQHGRPDQNVISRLHPSWGAVLLENIDVYGGLRAPVDQVTEFTALETLERATGGKPFSGEEGARLTSSDLASTEALLLASNWCFNHAGWIRPELYYSDYVSSLLDELPPTNSPAEHEAVRRQGVKLEALIDDLRQSRVTLTPTAPFVPVATAQRYATHLAGTLNPQAGFREGDIVVTRERGRLILDLQRMQTTQREKVFLKLKRYLSELNRKPEEEADYRHYDAGFLDFVVREDLQAEIMNNYARQGWAMPEWPERQITRTLTGWNRKITPHPWQNKAAWRTSIQRRGIIAHGTGLGKTFEIIMSALELAKNGQRTMMVVPNQVLPQIRQEYMRCSTVPLHIIGATQEEDGSWRDVSDATELSYQLADAVRANAMLLLINYSSFERIPLQNDKLKALLLEEVGEKEAELFVRPSGVNQELWSKLTGLRLEQMIEEGTSLPSADAVSDRLRSIAEQLELLDGADETGARTTLREQLPWLNFLKQGYEVLGRRETGLSVYWHMLRVRGLLVDEAHNFKNCWSTGRSGVRYLGSSGSSSQRGADMALKARQVQKDGGATVGYTATPYKNSLVDVYNLVRMFAPEVWERASIFDASQFVQRFCDISSEMVTGENGEAKRVLTLERIHNIRELRALTLPYIDRQTAKEVGLPEPELRSEYVLHRPTPEAVEVIKLVAEAPAEALIRYGHRPNLALITDLKLQRTEANRDARVLMLLTQRAELDMELIDHDLHRGHVSPKLDGFLQDIAQLVAEGKKVLAFCDTLNMPDRRNRKNLNPNGYNFHQKVQRLLVERCGLNAAQIGLINSVATPTPESRLLVQRKFNQGLMRVVLGNTQLMGESLNMQEDVSAIRHLDLPANPAGMDQRWGRVRRQGNNEALIDDKIHMGTRGLDAEQMDVMRGKQGLYDQFWSGTEDVMDNPERDVIPSHEKIRALAIDDDDERAAEMHRLRSVEIERQGARKRTELVPLWQEYAGKFDYVREVDGEVKPHPSRISARKRYVATMKALRAELSASPHWHHHGALDDPSGRRYLPSLDLMLSVGDRLMIDAGPGWLNGVMVVIDVPRHGELTLRDHRGTEARMNGYELHLHARHYTAEEHLELITSEGRSELLSWPDPEERPAGFEENMHQAFLRGLRTLEETSPACGTLVLRGHQVYLVALNEVRNEAEVMFGEFDPQILADAQATESRCAARQQLR